MHTLYNIVLCLINVVFRWAGARRQAPTGKFGQFIQEQRNLLPKVAEAMAQRPDSHAVVWIHASSYGEYNVVRPVIKALNESGRWHIVLTFFSPTGINQLKHRHEYIDEVFALPLDTPSNASQFLDILNPAKAIFVISEFWVNYLTELQARQIPTYLISANITERAPFFHFYGGLFRKALQAFTHIFVLNESSRRLLEQVGYTRVTVSGDPLFDSVLTRAAKDYHNTIIENFASQGDVFIAGSVHNDQDLQLVTSLVNRHPEIRFLIVPHEIGEQVLSCIVAGIAGRSRLFLECTEETDFSDTQVLVVDFVGALAYLYRFARWAYVGGGFTPYLHSVIEATAYGLPVAFGPKVQRKLAAQELMANGVGHSVATAEELEAWFSELLQDETALASIREKALAYMERHRNSTETVVNKLLEE